MRWLLVVLLLAGCQVQGELLPANLVSIRQNLTGSADKPIEFMVPIWTFRF